MQKNWKNTFALQGRRFTATVSTRSYLFPTYGLEMRVQMHEGGVVHLRNERLLFNDASEPDALKLIGQVRVKACTCCGELAFDHAMPVSNRAGLCERCFAAGAHKEFAKSLVQEALKASFAKGSHCVAA